MLEKVFAAAVGGRKLAQVTRKISSLYSNEVEDAAPLFVKAHIAQLVRNNLLLFICLMLMYCQA
jgi:hypothetical protein